MPWQRTLVLVKPDGVERALVGEVLGRLERRGLRLAGLRLLRFSRRQAGAFYSPHRGRPFFAPLVRFLASGPSVAVAVEGREAVLACRRLVGSTDAAEAAPGTIRGDLALDRRHNVVHASDSPASARRELALVFPGPRARSLRRALDQWVDSALGPRQGGGR